MKIQGQQEDKERRAPKSPPDTTPSRPCPAQAERCLTPEQARQPALRRPLPAATPVSQAIERHMPLRCPLTDHWVLLCCPAPSTEETEARVVQQARPGTSSREAGAVSSPPLSCSHPRKLPLPPATAVCPVSACKAARTRPRVHYARPTHPCPQPAALGQSAADPDLNNTEKDPRRLPNSNPFLHGPAPGAEECRRHEAPRHRQPALSPATGPPRGACSPTATRGSDRDRAGRERSAHGSAPVSHREHSHGRRTERGLPVASNEHYVVKCFLTGISVQQRATLHPDLAVTREDGSRGRYL